jgi:uncharacterized protein
MPAKPARKTGPKAGQGVASAGRPGKPCPICGRPPAAASLPFCSERCRNVDLNRWLSGSYVIPVTQSDEEDEQ